MRETYRTIMCVLALFFGNNEVTIQRSAKPIDREDSFNGFEVVAGLEADVHSSSDMTIDETAHADELFVHAGMLSSVLGCTDQTARNRLKELEQHGLIEKHSNADYGDGRGTIMLYRPAVEKPGNFISAVDELAGVDSANANDGFTEVTPSQFENLGDGKWQYTRNSNVIVDVTRPENTSIRASIESQLSEFGLKPSSPRNFQHQLREKAGLT